LAAFFFSLLDHRQGRLTDAPNMGNALIDSAHRRSVPEIAPKHFTNFTWTYSKRPSVSSGAPLRFQGFVHRLVLQAAGGRRSSIAFPLLMFPQRRFRQNVQMRFLKRLP